MSEVVVVRGLGGDRRGSSVCRARRDVAAALIVMVFGGLRLSGGRDRRLP